jgi:hypothetical protein
MMSCGQNISTGSRVVAVNKISTGKTGQPDLIEVNTSNTPIPKTWQISLEANRRIPTSSTVSLARRAGTVAEVLHPAHVTDVMSSTKSI